MTSVNMGAWGWSLILQLYLANAVYSHLMTDSDGNGRRLDAYAFHPRLDAETSSVVLSEGS